MRNLIRALIALVILFGFSLIVGLNHYSARGAPVPAASPQAKVVANAIRGQVHVSHGGDPGGVWVIAETNDLPTKFRKIVVTDSKGRFVIPDLPNATFNVFVRGFGLVDSTPESLTPGPNNVILNVDTAATPQEASYYPGDYWYSLLEPPEKSMFPGTGTGPGGNGIPTNLHTQYAWINTIKGGCELCHRLGSPATRDHVLPQDWDSTWKETGGMNNVANSLGRDVALQVFGNWGAAIANGAVPPTPPRPQGIERNFVLTMWNWGDKFAYNHDISSTDKRNPTLYPNGKVYGGDIGSRRIFELDPNTNTVAQYDVPFFPGVTMTPCDIITPLNCFTLPAYGGNTIAGPHTIMRDNTGKVWFTRVAPTGTVLPDFCTDGSRGDVPLPNPGFGIGYFDTVTKEFVNIHACQSTHHLQFDKNGVLWTSTGIATYWFDPSKFDPNNASATEGPATDWSNIQVDANCDGVFDTNIDSNGQRITNGYGIITNLVDGSVWVANPGTPGNIVRFDPATKHHEVYVVPFPSGYPRGIDADTNGKIWTCLAGSSQVAEFDRSKCAKTCGAGDQCPEGWTTYDIPGPHFAGVPELGGASDFHYTMWVDQFNVIGLGANEVFCNGTGSDELIGFNPLTHKFTRIRVPYPIPFYQRGLDGRIDDPNAGWKGRGIWVGNNMDPIQQVEENDSVGYVVHVQLRPNPLAH
ncbi:MAG: hypothetical protein ACM3SR_11560 [Ignavibacteriales bacterium]